MKKLILLLTFVLIARLGSAQAIYFTMDSVWVPPYICQASHFDVEVFGMVSDGMTRYSTHNIVVSNDTIYVKLFFITGPGGTATPYPLYKKINVTAPLIFGQYKIMAQGFYNGQLHKFLTSGISICAGMLATPEQEKTDATLTIFPNPAADLLQITFPKSYTSTILTLTDTSGKTVQIQKIGIGISKTELNLRSLPAGLYFLQAASAEGEFTEKIIKH